MNLVTTDITLTVPLDGQTFAIDSINVNDWASVDSSLPSVTLQDLLPCTFRIEYNGIEYTGVAAKSAAYKILYLAFDQQDVVLPVGVCIEVSCDFGAFIGEDHTHCHDTQVQSITSDSKLQAVSEDSGCLNGYIDISQVLTYLRNNLNIPESICDLQNVSSIPHDGVIGSDRVLVTNSGCDIKSVSQSSIGCS